MDTAVVEQCRAALSAPGDGWAFYAAEHMYSYFSSPVPSVTSVLADTGYVDTTYMTDAGRERGTLVHLLCQAESESWLPDDSLSADHQGYIDAWRQFKADTGWVSITIEQPLFSTQHRFGGTPDYIGYFPGDTYLTVLDLKSGSVLPATRFQVAAYIVLVNERLVDANIRLMAAGRGAVQVQRNGRYRLKAYDMKSLTVDSVEFLHALKSIHGGTYANN